MKTILCYGDSLTWGYNVEGPSRHPLADRWPSVLGAALGSAAHVIPDGLNGRTTIYDDQSVLAERNGAKTLPTSISTHLPLDLVILALGTNDLKRHTGGGRAFEAGLGMERLIEIVQSFPYRLGYKAPKILIVSPPHLVETEDPMFAQMFGHGIEESQRVIDVYRTIAEEYGVHLFDASEVCEATPQDGVHLDAVNTRRLGEALAGAVKEILDLQ
ncbi:SGNH/GDSL hydrolase family protein [Mangrovicella endophytica]|uniref:SGNH/GDSL hydrolase family protein n=1 Tax=Mangrovicella endophytica TaxID=2066697 RepID=UPI000C9DFBCB|nr:SGNH/GDSL hydrolase family protein [Mangrovicella endophytica]